MINLIYASDINGGIGIDNRLPWNKPQDLKKFKELTDGNVVFMGSATWNSLPYKLPNRTNVVVGSVESSDKQPDVNITSDVIVELKRLSEEHDVWIIGGKYTYESLIDLVDVIWHTEIDDIYKCDTFFNHHEHGEFVECESEYIGNGCTITCWMPK